jgi:hypothetical protein
VSQTVLVRRRGVHQAEFAGETYAEYIVGSRAVEAIKGVVAGAIPANEVAKTWNVSRNWVVCETTLAIE